MVLIGKKPAKINAPGWFKSRLAQRRASKKEKHNPPAAMNKDLNTKELPTPDCKFGAFLVWTGWLISSQSAQTWIIRR
ncbi:MAG: hypothetical protein IPF56_00080 [Chloroflexi bacterium]|nr:hypothetical protein [Chloroflexota bacterium]MBK6710553.1 hypothetical protein [Chloroflexota bacterium]MBK7179833.1 hypothetical protein [Chloroflexota bacterium]MBP7590073.1 hypothetical protein [Chloroflexota bacterium]